MIPKIDSYAFGHVVVDGTSYTSDVILLPDRVLEGWRREESHRLEIEDLWDALECGPELLVVGTGAYGVMEVPEATAAYVRARGVELAALETAAAVELYNSERGRKRTVAALHLTC